MDDNFNNIPQRIDPKYSNMNDNENNSTPDNSSFYAAPDGNRFDSGTAVGSIVSGILSTLLFWIPVIPLILGIVGIFLCGEDRKKCLMYRQPFSGTATAGKVCSVIGIILNLLMYIVFLFVPSLFASFTIFSL